MNRNHSSNHFNRNYTDNRLVRQTTDAELHWWLAIGRTMRRSRPSVSLPASPHLPAQVSTTPSGTVRLQAKDQGLRVSAGDPSGLCPLVPVLSPLSLTERGWGGQEQRSLHRLSTHTACQTKTKPQIQMLTWSKGSSLTFEHIYKKRQNKTSKLLQTEVRVSKYLRNTICRVLFSNSVLHLLNSNWSKSLSTIIPHYISTRTHTSAHRYYFPLTAIHKDENLYALTL